MEPIHRPNERFFIQYKDSKNTTAVRDSFEKLCDYVREMRSEKPYGVRLIYKPYYRKFEDVTIPYGAENYLVSELLTDWWTKISNRAFYYLLIEQLIFFEEDKKIVGKIFYWNKEVENLCRIQRYFFESSRSFEESNIFDSYVWQTSRDCYFGLKKYIDYAVNPSEEDILKSKFETMSTSELNQFHMLLKKSETIIKRMEGIVEDIEKKGETWRFIIGKRSPLYVLKEVFELLNKRFFYQKTFEREN